MERRMRRVGNLPGPAQQLDLFDDNRRRAIVDTPAWLELPAETRAALTGLMARLILEHVDGSRAGSPKEAGDDL
jgi:GTP-binding protein EngB required for normal cell division